MPTFSSVEGRYGFGRSAKPVPVASGPALYYDPSSSSSYSGSGTTLNNIGSGGTMTGTLRNVTYTNTGGGYFSFNGSSSYISFNSFNFTSTFTVCAWVNATSKYSINTLLANCAANTNTNGFKIYWNSWNTTNGYLVVEAGNSSTGGSAVSGTAVITAGTWQHLAWTYNVTNRIINFYNNGSLVATVNPAGTPTNPNMNQAWDIGYMKAAYYMNSRLGYLKVWTSILSTASITADYTASKARFGL